MPTTIETIWSILAKALTALGRQRTAEEIAASDTLDDLGLGTLFERVGLLKRVRDDLRAADLIADQEAAQRPVYGFAVKARTVLDVLRYMQHLAGVESGTSITTEHDVSADETRDERDDVPDGVSSEDPGTIRGGYNLGSSRTRSDTTVTRTGEPPRAADSWTTTIHFATDRVPAPDPIVGWAFGAQRSSQVMLGQCDVSIPSRRKLGELSRPKWWKLEFRPNPKKHFFLKSASLLSPAQFGEGIRNRLEATQSRELLVFVHGYNVSFESAALRTAQLALDLRFNGAPVLYSWPSRGRIDSYPQDAASAANSALSFSSFLSGLSTATGAEQIHVIAHSMGNQVVCAAMHQIGLTAGPSPKPVVGHLALAAPDIDRDLYRRMADMICGVSRSVTLYASSRDRAIRASKAFNGAPRAGEPLVVTPGVVTIDASAVDTDFLSHGFYSDDPAVLQDLYGVLRGVDPSQRFSLKREVSAEGAYYEFVT